jgi:iron complex transport system substrate-binding protein
MKKFVLVASVLLAVYSCKKEGAKQENTTETSSEAPKSSNKIVVLTEGLLKL